MKLIAYLSNGYPTLEKSNQRGKFFVENGVDIIEADFPAKDPYLDSYYLRSRIFTALDAEANYDRYIEMLVKLLDDVPGMQYLVNIYEETLKEIGIEKFVDFMRKIGQNQVLLVGKTDETVRDALEANQLYASSFVTRAMLEEDLELAGRSNGFIYLEGFGDESTYSKDYPTLKDCVQKVREVIGPDRQIYVGIGLHTLDRIRETARAGADGGFLGSIILRKEDAGEDMAAYLKEIRQAANER